MHVEKKRFRPCLSWVQAFPGRQECHIGTFGQQALVIFSHTVISHYGVGVLQKHLLVLCAVPSCRPNNRAVRMPCGLGKHGSESHSE